MTIKNRIKKKCFELIDSRIKETQETTNIKLSEAKKNSDRIENEMYRTYKALEYKFWQFNTSTNKILYELSLKNLTKKKNFNPLVSIIVPVYNGANYLEEAIKSALAQTYKNIEIIIVNDGSSDDDATKRAAMKFKKQIRYFEKDNGGVSSALNFGIKRMEGEYFSWLSHDDLIDPTHIEKLIEYCSHNGTEKDIPFSSFKIIDEAGRLKLDETIVAQIHCSDYKISVLQNELSLLMGEINGGSVLIPREAFLKHGYFDENLRITQERDMWSRLIEEYHFVNIPFDTASIRSHGKQVTNTNNEVIKKSNEKRLEINDGISEETMVRLFGSKNAFYQNLLRFYIDNNNPVLAEKIREKLD